jgi:demethoxyubiquinone hydroxylase (CLK1/Coq7/Cat5 family)
LPGAATAALASAAMACTVAVEAIDAHYADQIAALTTAGPRHPQARSAMTSCSTATSRCNTARSSARLSAVVGSDQGRLQDGDPISERI